MSVVGVSSRRRHTRLTCDWSSDVCSSDLGRIAIVSLQKLFEARERLRNGGRIGVRREIADGCGFGGKYTTDGSDSGIEGMAQGIERGRDGLLGLDRGFSFGGSLGKIVCTKIGGSAFERVREAISGGGIVGGEGGLNVVDDEGLRFSKALEQRFVTPAIAAGALECSGSVDPGDEEFAANGGWSRSGHGRE